MRRHAEIQISAENLEEQSIGLASFFGHGPRKAKSVRSSVSGPLFKGFFETHSLESGLHLFAVDLHVSGDTALHVEVGRPLLGFSILLSGKSRHVVLSKQGRGTSLDFVPGHNVIGMYHPEKTRFELKGGEMHRLVEVQIDAAAFPSFLEDSQQSPPKVLRPFLERSPARHLALNNSLSPSLEAVAHQVINCPIQGKARRLFMQAKALEILAYQFDALSDAAPVQQFEVGKNDIHKLVQARTILDEEFADPPSLVELARRIGLNDFKLKRSFREVFGTTVYGYVRRLRMDKARAMLESGECSVTEAAFTTGYNCLGYFSSAFKKQFGILPRQCKKGWKAQ